MNKLIPLEFNRKHIEDILFANNSVNYFRNEEARKTLPWAIFFTILVASILFYNNYREVYWQIYLVTAPMLLYYTISYYKTARFIFQYKKSIKSWMDNISKYNKHHLEITENSISVVMDNDITLQTWSSILSCKMDEVRIALKGSEQFYLPARSMSQEDYIFLQETIKRKIKNDEL